MKERFCYCSFYWRWFLTSVSSVASFICHYLSIHKLWRIAQVQQLLCVCFAFSKGRKKNHFWFWGKLLWSFLLFIVFFFFFNSSLVHAIICYWLTSRVALLGHTMLCYVLLARLLEWNIMSDCTLATDLMQGICWKSYGTSD